MENNEYVHWYYNPECQAFIADLIKDLNEQSQQYYSSPEKWENSSYHNDSCGSVHFNLNNDTETYVQLFAFHNQEEATKEGIDERFSIQTVINGKEQLIEVGSNIPTDGSTCLIMNDREEAIKEALEAVSALLTKLWNEVHKPVTVEQVKNWVGSNWTFDNLCLLLSELANGDYEQEQFKKDIDDTWSSTQ